MGTAEEIRFDYQQALSRAKALEEIAGEMTSLAQNSLAGSLQILSGGWKGEAATAYLNKGAMLEEKIIKSAKNLRGTAATIRTIAKTIYDAEMYALQLAQQRAYDQ